MTEKLPEFLAAWITRQRWFAGKSGQPLLEVVWRAVQELSADSVLEEWIIHDASDPDSPPYYVPVVARNTLSVSVPPSSVIDADHGRVLVDAPHDPDYAARILSLCSHDVPLRSLHSRVLAGEQSNTSILFRTDSATASSDAEPSADVIVKVFRRAQAGENPDVVLQSALSEAGITRVPRAIGHASLTWRQAGSPHTGHLAFAQEFVPDVEDAWRVTLDLLAAGRDPSDSLHELGRATAEVHTALAELFPTHAPSPARVATMLSSMRARAQSAARAVPALADQLDAVSQIYETLSVHRWPPFQRVHGDYHLGQVLLAPGRGWLLVDFEGEPLRSLAERDDSDVALRDVAGMLRSLDYAAAASMRAGHRVDVGWTQRARAAFIAGYDSLALLPTTAASEILRAFELDKALYEVTYEAGNRPDWVEIPLEAVMRLLEPI